MIPCSADAMGPGRVSVVLLRTTRTTQPWHLSCG
jgi:hypothetical protein